MGESTTWLKLSTLTDTLCDFDLENLSCRHSEIFQ